MARAGKSMEGVKVAMIMIMVQVVTAGINIVYLLAIEDGMNMSIVLAYQFLVATVFLAPIALIYERNKRPKLTWTILGQCFLSSTFGGLLSEVLYLKGLILTSVTVAGAIINLIPAITFILAILFRMEKLAIRTSAGKVKLVGTLVGIAGAMVITIYKGREISLWPSSHIHLNPHHAVKTMAPPPPLPSIHDHVFGVLLCLASSVVYAAWFITQAKISENYPCFYSSTALMSFMAMIQCGIFAAINDHRWVEWKLGWNIRLFAVSYIGMINGMVYAISTRCVQLKGPLFVSIFGPLRLVIVSILGTLILGQHLHLGSVIGGTIIVGGLYLVLWGKMKAATET